MATIPSAQAQASSISSLPVICGVYCITHIETGRSYVGQSIDCVRRMLDHARYNDYAIGHAIRRYGRDAFRFEILSVVSRDKLLAYESGWIKLLGTDYPNGFNMTGAVRYRTSRKPRNPSRVKRNGALKRQQRHARHEREAAERGIFA